MHVYVVQTCIRCGINVYLGGTKMGGTKRRWYKKPGYYQVRWNVSTSITINYFVKKVILFLIPESNNLLKIVGKCFHI